MKTSDLFLISPKTTIAAAGLLMVFSLTTRADAPSPETFTKSSELVLTLSDDWLQADKQTSFKTQNSSNTNTIITNKAHEKPVKVDCGMDVNQFAGNDNSLSSRLTGECELHYNY